MLVLVLGLVLVRTSTGTGISTSTTTSTGARTNPRCEVLLREERRGESLERGRARRLMVSDEWQAIAQQPLQDVGRALPLPAVRLRDGLH